MSSLKKMKKKNKAGTEPNVLVNTSALITWKSPPEEGIETLKEIFGRLIDENVIQLVLSECDNDVYQATESLSSLVDSGCHLTQNDSQIEARFPSSSESTIEDFQPIYPDVQNSSEEPICSNTLNKSFASALNCPLIERTNPENPVFSVNSDSFPSKCFSRESSYLPAPPSKHQASTVDKQSLCIEHICTIINKLNYGDLKSYLPGYFPSQKCDRIFNNINLGLPVLIILRGLPGSGKSTLASALKGNGVVFSADDYFYKNGCYRFVPYLLPDAHEWNQLRAKEALIDRKSPIIIDNTNLKAWEMSTYVSLGLKQNYIIEIIEPATSWKFKPSELSKRNVHQVTKKGIQDMLAKYENADIVCNSLKKNKFASVFACPFANLERKEDNSNVKKNSEVVSNKNSDCFQNINANSKIGNSENITISESEKFKLSSKEKEVYSHNQPNNNFALKFEQNLKPMFGSRRIQDKKLKAKNRKPKFTAETLKDSSQLRSSYNPLVKLDSFKQDPLCEHMKGLELSTEEEVSLPAVECASNIFPCSLLNEKLNESSNIKLAVDEEPKNFSAISTEVDKCDPDSSESEISVDIHSESETNYSPSVSSWVTSSEDMSENVNSKRPDKENDSLEKQNFKEEAGKRLNNERNLNPVFPKPPRNKSIFSPFGKKMSVNELTSIDKLKELENLSESWDSCDVNSSDSAGVPAIVDNSEPKPRRETWKQIEKSSLAILSPHNKRDKHAGVELEKKELQSITKPYSPLRISAEQTELEASGKFSPLNSTCITDIDLPKPVDLSSNQNLSIPSPSKLRKDAPASSSKYTALDWEFPKPYRLTPPPSNKRGQNRQPLIIGADKYLGKNWDLPDCLISPAKIPEAILEKKSQTINSLQTCSETQTESNDFIFIDRIRKNHPSSEELKKSIYTIVFANVHHSTLSEKENLSEEPKEQSFSPKSNNKLDASTNTEDYSVDIADNQKLSYIKECFPDMTEEELETYLGLCQGDVHWASDIIIENENVSQKFKKDPSLAEGKYTNPLNESFKSISLESIPDRSVLSCYETSPLKNSKNWSSDGVLFETRKKRTQHFPSADENRKEENQLFEDIKTDKSQSSSEEDSLKLSDKITLKLSLEDAQELQFRYGPIVENKDLLSPTNREIILDPELVYSLWMSTQSLKESNTDQCQKNKKRKLKSKARRNIFHETESETSNSKKIDSNPQTLSEIMDMEYALKLEEEEKLKKDTQFIKEKRLKLYSLYPGMDRRYLDDVFDSNNYNVKESKFCIDATYAMIEEDSKSAAASPIVSELKKNKYDKPYSEDAIPYFSKAAKTSSIASKHNLNRISPSVLPSYRKSSTSIEKRSFIQSTRELAQSELAAKKEMRSKATDAFQKKNMGVAAYYAEKAREHHWNANEHFDAICEFIREDSKSYELDLHNCSLQIGIKLLCQFLNDHEQRLRNWREKNYPRLSIITGYGKHSKAGPVLQPTVMKFLRKNKYMFCTDEHYGMFYVSLKRNDENVKWK